MSATAPRPRWLFGPGSDLLLGCGGAYLLFFVAITALGVGFMSAAPMWVLLLLLLVTAVPHYGATLVRAYERPEDRSKYRVFTIWAAILVWGAFVISVYDPRFGSWFLTLNLTWSPWHYSGQNYGIGLMMLGRRGVRVTPQAKRLIYLSFLLSWILVVLASHGGGGSVSYTPSPIAASDSAYVFIPLGIPIGIALTGMVLAGAAYIAVIVGAFLALRREGARLRDLSPLVVVLLLQGLWFSLPVVARSTDTLQGILPLSISHQVYILQWMALAHSAQYLWVTTYYARSSRAETRSLRYWLKIYLAGATTFAIPVLLFSPDLLGVYSFDEGLGVLVASAVNLHHFALDGAIWKLRDGRIARVLLRSPREVEALPPEFGSPPRRISWVPPLLLASGVAYGLFTVVGTWELEWGFRRALERGDTERMRTAAQRMSWVGRSSFALHYDLGVLALREGDLETAQREVERSLQLAPKPEAWVTLGRIHARAERWPQALAAHQQALVRDPENVSALNQSALVLVRLGRSAEAQEALARAVALAPERDDLRERLQRLSQGAAAASDS